MELKIVLVTIALLITASAHDQLAPRPDDGKNQYDQEDDRSGDDDRNRPDVDDVNSRDDDRERDMRPARVWTFAFGRQWAPFEQLDAEKREVVGFGIDIIHEACRVAHQHCEFVFIKDYNDCWNNDMERSPALDNRWFDGCGNYNPTFESELGYKFSTQYSRNIENALYTRSNDNLEINDFIRDNNEVTIGLVTAYYPTVECLTRHGVHVNEERTRFYISPDSLMEALRNGEVRVAFTLNLGIDMNQFRKLEVEREFRCTTGGISVMARKDNQELFHWLNPALQAVIDSPMYPRTCYIWEQIFGIHTYCVDRDERNDAIRN